MRLLDRLSHYIAQARQVSATHGVSAVRQYLEILQLSRAPGRIGPGDYYSYRLFEPSLAPSAKREFVGWRMEPWLDSLNDRGWHCLGLDKVLMYAIFENAGIRVPETRAIYLPNRSRPLAGSE